MLENTKMYSKTPSCIYGFHGCSKETFEKVIYNNQPLNKSTNRYDWLGNGIYFWENSYQRAVEWAITHYGEKNAAVIGAFIDLGYCLDLTDYDYVRGTFSEGEEVYPGSAFQEKTHTQVCIVNPNCIKGYFVPREANENYTIP